MSTSGNFCLGAILSSGQHNDSPGRYSRHCTANSSLQLTMGSEIIVDFLGGDARKLIWEWANAAQETSKSSFRPLQLESHIPYKVLLQCVILADELVTQFANCLTLQGASGTSWGPRSGQKRHFLLQLGHFDSPRGTIGGRLPQRAARANHILRYFIENLLAINGRTSWRTRAFIGARYCIPSNWRLKIIGVKKLVKLSHDIFLEFN